VLRRERDSTDSGRGRKKENSPSRDVCVDGKGRRSGRKKRGSFRKRRRDEGGPILLWKGGEKQHGPLSALFLAKTPMLAATSTRRRKEREGAVFHSFTRKGAVVFA